MTAIKRCCALALAVLMILTALPVTAFAETAAHETNASLHETTLDGIANDITRQVLRSSQKDGERIQMENTAKLDDSDEVEIIVVVNDSVADPDSRAQVNALLRTQKSALAQIERALDTKVEPPAAVHHPAQRLLRHGDLWPVQGHPEAGLRPVRLHFPHL
jgi:hypothetical protein